MRKKYKPKKAKPGDPLTVREIQVLKLICNEVAPMPSSQQLGISDKTFFNHRSSLLIKTRSKTNIGLYRYALKKNIVKLR